MNEEYMSMAEVRQILGMPKYQYSEKQVRQALVEYNKNNFKKIILVEEWFLWKNIQ